MSETTRKQRLAGSVRQLIKLAIAEKQVQAGASLVRMCLALEGWGPKSIQEEEIPQQKPVDMSALLEHLPEPKEN